MEKCCSTCSKCKLVRTNVMTTGVCKINHSHTMYPDCSLCNKYKPIKYNVTSSRLRKLLNSLLRIFR